MLRIGHGYDAHRLAEGRALVLGGVDIPYEKGLLGHSDADVLTHAVIDALLGAAGLGDIGRHFPDTDEKYRGISSIALLKECAAMINAKGYTICNIDVTLIAQAPKIAPYIADMVENIASALVIPLSRVNIKATTEEHMGFTGDGSGMCCHAVTIISK